MTLARRIVVRQAEAHGERGLDKGAERADQLVVGRLDDRLVKAQIGLHPELAVVAGRLQAAIGVLDPLDLGRVARNAASEAAAGSMTRRNSKKILDVAVDRRRGEPPCEDVGIEEVPILAWSHPRSGFRSRLDEAFGGQHLDRLRVAPCG